MTRPDDWRRVSKAERCPVCSRADWCLIVGPEGNPTAAICPRVESPKRCDEAGWLHVLRDDGPTWAPWRRTLRRAVRLATRPEAAPLDFAKLAADAVTAVKPEALDRLARALGLSADSLRRLSVGWLADRRAWSFPMRSADGSIVGIRLRLANGRKLSIRGGKEGLFVPEDLRPGGRLLICEGPTDTAAALDWGFPAVGRPSCTGGAPRLVDLVSRLRPAEVVIVADGDTPGRRGADGLARGLVAYVAAVKVIAPPNEIKDARAWLRSGATAADVAATIDAAAPRRLTVTTTRTKGRMLRCPRKATA